MRQRKVFSPLNKKGDFKKVFEQGHKFPSRYLVIFAIPNERTQSRLGLSVSRKIGGAVKRNKVKRLLREALRKQLEDTPMHCDFVIVARKSSVEAKFSDLNKVLYNCISRVAHEINFDTAD